MPAFIALLGRRLKVSVLIDGSRSANRLARMKSAAKDNEVLETAIVLCSDVKGAPSNADIEDMFAVEDYLRLYNWAFGASLAESDLPATREPIIRRVTANPRKRVRRCPTGPRTNESPHRVLCRDIGSFWSAVRCSLRSAQLNDP